MNDFNASADRAADEAKQFGRDAANKAQGLASEAKSAAGDAIDSGRAYARDAVDAAGTKINHMKSQFDQTCDYVTKAIHDEPVKAVLITAVVSSLLTALVAAAIANEERHFLSRR